MSVFEVGDIVNVEPSVRSHYIECFNIKVVDKIEVPEFGNCEFDFAPGKISLDYVNKYPEEFILMRREKKKDDGTVDVVIGIDTSTDDYPEGMDDFIKGVREQMATSIASQPRGLIGVKPFPGATLSLPANVDPVALEKYKETITKVSGPTVVETNLEDIPSHKPEQLGLYRPDLDTRKVGKVGMHMFIDGFPNAMYEVARVMQWAADNKGYKLHDWKNLPEAEVALSSAGYRHLVDNAVQRAAGVVPADRVDHESELLHLAHLAFNILAQIELIKTNKIQ